MIEIKNVTKIYDGIRAVNQLNLTVRDGEIFVLLGSSGCGKSTTLNMINRLIEPTEGNIYIDGKDIKDFKPEILRRSIGYVVQGTGLFPNMTVGQNIGIVPKMLKWNSQEIKRRVKELLEMIGLDPDKYVKKYKRRVKIGQQKRKRAGDTTQRGQAAAGIGKPRRAPRHVRLPQSVIKTASVQTISAKSKNNIGENIKK